MFSDFVIKKIELENYFIKLLESYLKLLLYLDEVVTRDILAI